MPFSGVVNPDELALLTRVLEQHCRNNHIDNETDRLLAATLIMSRFTSGARTIEELSAALADAAARPSNNG